MAGVAVTAPELGDVQGLIARGYANLAYARFLLLTVTDGPTARSLLCRLLPEVTDGRARPTEVALNVAVTAHGLTALGIPDRVVGTFSREYVAGMTDAHASRLLGDAGASAPASWEWGGPSTPTVDVAVLVYAASADAVEHRAQALHRDAEESGLMLAASLDTAPLGLTEPFGFHDGISQPLLEGLPKAAGSTAPVRFGEFVLGYPNEYGRLTERPVVPPGDDPHSLLPPHEELRPSRDLGRNGSYLVARSLRQDVDVFWGWAEQETRARDGGVDHDRAVALAAKVVGRWPSGAPLGKAPQRDDPSLADDNDFAYHYTDPAGLACPIGSHVRRANPRDSLDPAPGSQRSVAVGNRHRLLRRGRSYLRADGETGLHFLCLGANLSRQFEFVQHTWLANPNFNGLHDDSDPLVGPRGARGATFTVPALPVRRRYRDLPQFVTVRGGAYLFLPGIRALHWIAGTVQAGR